MKMMKLSYLHIDFHHSLTESCFPQPHPALRALNSQHLWAVKQVHRPRQCPQLPRKSSGSKQRLEMVSVPNNWPLNKLVAQEDVKCAQLQYMDIYRKHLVPFVTMNKWN